MEIMPDQALFPIISNSKIYEIVVNNCEIMAGQPLFPLFHLFQLFQLYYKSFDYFNHMHICCKTLIGACCVKL